MLRIDKGAPAAAIQIVARHVTESHIVYLVQKPTQEPIVGHCRSELAAAKPRTLSIRNMKVSQR